PRIKPPIISTALKTPKPPLDNPKATQPLVTRQPRIHLVVEVRALRVIRMWQLHPATGHKCRQLLAQPVPAPRTAPITTSPPRASKAQIPRDLHSFAGPEVETSRRDRLVR
ncbi:hypothetical protein Vretifemale_15837, partial [Volvox reticuliferus]